MSVLPVQSLLLKMLIYERGYLLQTHQHYHQKQLCQYLQDQIDKLLADLDN